MGYHEHINMMILDLLPVIAAGFAAVLFAWVWYAPFVFGGVWMRSIGMTPEMVERGKRQMHVRSLVALLASMLTAWVMSYVGQLLGVYDWFGAIELGFWCWIGFAATPMLGMVLWEQRPIRYYVIVAGYWLLAFILMALILVLLPQTFSGQYRSDTGSYDYSAQY